MKSVQLVIIAAFIAVGATPKSSAQTSKDVVGHHYGYIMDVEQEKSSRTEELNFTALPPKEKSRDLKSLIFDEELTKEFNFQYEQRFGRSAVERNFINPGRFDEFFYRTGVSVSLEEDRRRKRVFGEYMVKRLGEHHVDQYVKSQPDLRAVYELKDRLSNVDVEVKKGYKVRMKYSVSGGYFQLKLENPYEVDTRVLLQMDPAQFGPSQVIETRFSFDYSLSRTVHFNSDFFIERGGARFVTRKDLGEGVSTSLTVSSFSKNPAQELVRDEPSDLGFRAETLAIVGLTWNH